MRDPSFLILAWVPLFSRATNALVLNLGNRLSQQGAVRSMSSPGIVSLFKLDGCDVDLLARRRRGFNRRGRGVAGLQASWIDEQVPLRLFTPLAVGATVPPLKYEQ